MKENESREKLREIKRKKKAIFLLSIVLLAFCLVGIGCQKITDSPSLTLSPSVTVPPTVTTSPIVTPSPIVTIRPTETPSPTVTIRPTETPSPTVTIRPTETPSPTVTIRPTETPLPTVTIRPTETPSPTVTVSPTVTPSPTVTVTPMLTPSPSSTPAVSKDSRLWTFKGILLYSQQGEYSDEQVRKMSLELGSCKYIINSNEITNWTDWYGNEIITPEDVTANETVLKDLKGLYRTQGTSLKEYADSAVILAKRIISYNADARIYFTIPSIKFTPIAEKYTNAFCEMILKIKDEMGETAWQKNVEGFYFGTEDAVESWYLGFNADNTAHFECPTMKLVRNIDNRLFMVNGAREKKFLWIPFIGGTENSDSTVNRSSRITRIAHIANRSNLFDYIVIQSGCTFHGNKNAYYSPNISLISDSARIGRMRNSENTGFICSGNFYGTRLGFELEYEPSIGSAWGSTSDAYFDACVEAIGDDKYDYPIVFYIGAASHFDEGFEAVKKVFMK